MSTDPTSPAPGRLRRLLWLIAAVIAPLLVGLVAAAAIGAGYLADSTVTFGGPLREWALLAGGVCSLLLAIGLAAWVRGERAHRRELLRLHDRLADERRRFLLRLDHELKNPLTIIGGGIENLASDPSAQIRADALRAMQAQTERLRRLTAGLRRLADLESQALDLAPMQPGELLEQVVADARERPGVTPERLSLSLPALPLPPITGDDHLLALALFNLIDNALKFTPPDGRVAVRAFADDRRVLIEVHDNGPGIPADELAQVWDELYRGQGARGTPGSGLGLALARAIVLRHGGRVAIESRQGLGTIAKIALPAQG